jgi:hypothetical protein
VNEQTPANALVAQLARAAVAQAAPEELPLFRATSEAYFKDPAALERQASGDDLLGFGVADALVLVTPIALSVAREVLDFVVDEVGAHARETGRDVIDRLADRLLRRGDRDAQVGDGAERGGDMAASAAADVLSLTDEQLRQVRALAVEKAQQLALPPEQANLLADSLVGSLAIA